MFKMWSLIQFYFEVFLLVLSIAMLCNAMQCNVMLCYYVMVSIYVRTEPQTLDLNLIALTTWP